jgi:hypothetical protein
MLSSTLFVHLSFKHHTAQFDKLVSGKFLDSLTKVCVTSSQRDKEVQNRTLQSTSRNKPVQNRTVGEKLCDQRPTPLINRYVTRQ